ncbi:PTS sugar transporter subunit IIA [Paralimibaculum aggregatum]|uniref:PTS sugar transporter subunit IIA n=1 Tax=Paralimibaculum aggregatum TaxID=3036245 RepID=A0ABQ6LS94_9RHOB|nr:PTS sugar transporter subunit IIA [Limibaculum sp. NKW23]GMG84816.1 PTS sugar transporter subunit IIA [Limibaculum sp. NKW23]
MIGILIIAHGELAGALLAATEHVVGKQANARTVPIYPTDDLRARRAEIERIVHEIDSGDGVVLITDMFGGTPSNLALGSLQSAQVEVIWGANLPLLVKLAKSRDLPLAEAVRNALDAGHKYIDCASQILDPGRQA